MENREHHHVRIGQPADFDNMMVLLREMHAENGIAPLAEAKIIPPLQCALAQYHGLVGIIDGDDGDIAASVGLFTGEWWYSEDRHLEDRWNFVRAPYRSRRMARPLLEFSKQSAAALGLPLLMGVLSEARTEAKVALYKRQLPYAGAIFLWTPPGLKVSSAA